MQYQGGAVSAWVRRWHGCLSGKGASTAYNPLLAFLFFFCFLSGLAMLLRACRRVRGGALRATRLRTHSIAIVGTETQLITDLVNGESKAIVIASVFPSIRLFPLHLFSDTLISDLECFLYVYRPMHHDYRSPGIEVTVKTRVRELRVEY